MSQISLPLSVEIAYDWILIIIQLYVMILHYVKLRIQYRKSPLSKQKEMFKTIDSRTLSIGVLLFALFVVFNRFFGIIGVYGISLKSCDLYLSLAVIYAVLHKLFNYQFMLYRLKSQLKQLDTTQKPAKLKWIAFYTFSVFIILFEIYFIISATILQDKISEIDDNRCNFSPEALKNFVPLYGGADLLFSVILLFFFAFGLWKYKKIEANSTRQSVGKLLRRIIKWSVIAICSTFISTIVAAIIDGASPIFLVGDTVINSICAVMQFAPITWRSFKKEIQRECGRREKRGKTPTLTATGTISDDGSKGSKISKSGPRDSATTTRSFLTNFGVRGNVDSRAGSENIMIESGKLSEGEENAKSDVNVQVEIEMMMSDENMSNINKENDVNGNEVNCND